MNPHSANFSSFTRFGKCLCPCVESLIGLETDKYSGYLLDMNMNSINDNQSSQVMDLPNGNCLIFEKNDEGINYKFYKNHNCFNKSFKSIDQMQNQDMLCDITIVADHCEVRAHKVILAASSLFFHTMFSNMTELTMQRIVLDDIHSDALPAIIQYFYSTELLVTRNNVKYLLRTAKLLVLDDVFNACCHFLQAELSVDNCLRVAAFARENDCFDLVSQADAFIQQNFAKLVDSEEFLELPYQQLSEIIKSDELNVSDELKVFEAVVAWAKYKIESRMGYFLSLLDFVRFPLISQKDLIEKVSEECIFKASSKYFILMNEAMKYHLMSDEQKSSFSIPAKRPSLTSAIEENRDHHSLVAVGKISDKVSVEIYNFERQQWTQLPEFNIPWKRDTIILTADEKIYKINLSTREVDAFDLRSMKWSECCDLLTYGANWASAVFSNGNIYLTGAYYDGFNGEINCGEKLDHATGRWLRIADMKAVRNDHIMCSLKENIYAIGGRDNTGYLSSVQCYIPEKNCWQYVPPMTIKRSKPGAAEFDGKLYVLGGKNNANRYSKTMEVFDPVVGKWSKLADLAIEREQPGVAVHNGFLYVVGGYNNQGPIDSVEIYDPRTNTWSMLPTKMSRGGYTSVSAGIINFRPKI